MYTIKDKQLGPRPGPPIPISIQNEKKPPFSELLTRLLVSVFPIVPGPSAENKEGRIPEKRKKMEEEMIWTFGLLNPFEWTF